MDNSFAIQTFDLTKHYGIKAVVDKVNLNVKEGEIYGFIGRNGAGKTTVIKMLAGLVAPTEGSFALLGGKTPAELLAARKNLGTIIEAPAFYPTMSAAENVEVIRLMLGIKDKEVVKKCLDLVGLDYADPKAARYLSQGNKQRLGLAIALINDPKLLLLDEPVNGLDPTGMADIREAILNINRAFGTTVLISSHILGELQKMASSYGVINHGKLVAELSHEQLLLQRTAAIKLVCDDTFKAIGVLENALNTKNYKVKNGAIYIYDYLDNPTEVSKQLALGEVLIKEFSVGGDDLEGYFISLMEERTDA